MPLDVAKLEIPVWMWRSRQAFDVCPQRKAHLLQQPPYGHGRRRFQLPRQQPQRASHIFPPADRVAAHMVVHKRFQPWRDSGIFFSTRGRPAPSRRIRSAGQSFKSLSNSIRPRLIVFGSKPVARDNFVSPPQPTDLDNRPATNRCCSSNLANTKPTCCPQRFASCMICPPSQSFEKRRRTYNRKLQFRK